MSTLPITDVFMTGWLSRSCIVGLYMITLTSLVAALNSFPL